MSTHILHLLAQQPAFTGSGVTLDAIIRNARRAGLRQEALVGLPADGEVRPPGGLAPGELHALRFPGASRPFDLPGMSPVMPYRSTPFASLDREQIRAYRQAWLAELRALRARQRPALIHSHHTWILSSLVKDVFPQVPLVLHGHGTGLRQMELCPHLAEEVAAGCRRCDALAVLHEDHARAYRERLGIDAQRIHIVGAGFASEVFHARGRGAARAGALLYAGKLSRSKGLPWLLDAVAALAARRPEIELHIAGGGSGAEADELRRRMECMAPLVTYHGRLEQRELAALMRRSAIFVLPSLYEGLPLVLVEALASGCRLVATDLAGIARALAPHLGAALTLVEAPHMVRVDEPHPAALPGFRLQLAAALDSALAAPPLSPGEIAARIAPFTWEAVYRRIEEIWTALGGPFDTLQP